MNVINFILLVLLLLVSMAPLKCTNYNLVRFLCDLLSPLAPIDYSCKNTFSLVSQIKNANPENILLPTM